MDDLPPIVPKPAACSGWDILRQCLPQLTAKIEIRTTRDPINSVLLEGSRSIRGEGHSIRAGYSVGVGLLIRVVHTLQFIACDDLDVDFLIVVFVEEGTVTCARDIAGFYHSAYATVENVIILSRDPGSEDGRCGLASRYLQLQTLTTDGHI